MVCHETYKDNNNNWLSPNEIEKIDNNFVLKKKEKVKVGPLNQCLNQKKCN